MWKVLTKRATGFMVPEHWKLRRRVARNAHTGQPLEDMGYRTDTGAGTPAAVAHAERHGDHRRVS